MKFMAGSATRIGYSVVVLIVGVFWWVVLGIFVRIGIALAPADYKFITGTFTFGDYTFDSEIFVAMVVWTAVLAFLIGRALMAVWKGRPLRECLEFWQ